METFHVAKQSQKSQQMTYFTDQDVSETEKEAFEWIELIVTKTDQEWCLLIAH